jgi:beta-glucanase (GH16 family)
MHARSGCGVARRSAGGRCDGRRRTTRSPERAPQREKPARALALRLLGRAAMRKPPALLLVASFAVLAGGCSAAPSESVGSSAQRLTLGNIYNLGTLAHPGSCMDAQGGGTTNGTPVQEWTCNGSGAQSFQLQDAGNGAFYIVNMQANRCVDVQAAGTANGTRIQLYDCNGTPAQTFVEADAGNGSVYFVNKNSNKCLDVTAANAADGTLVQLYDCNQTSAQRWNPTVVGNWPWVLMWSDEFNQADGSAVDPSKWSYDTGGGQQGWGNNELEYYTSGTSNAVIQNEMLVITATTAGASNYWCWYGPCQYTSARLNTAGKFAQQYGRVEGRIQIPEGNGVWPGFWMLGSDLPSVQWPACGEIDIMESAGSAPNSVFGTTHGPGPGSYPYSGLSGAFNAGAPLGNAFHVYATEWDPGSVRFYVDNTLYWTVTPSQLPAGAAWVWNQPFFVLLNFAVGGNLGGSPDPSSYPKQMRIDYVRAYQRAQ